MLGRRALPAFVLAGFFAVAGACSFPDVEYGTGDAGRATDAYVSPDGYVAPGDDTGTGDGPSQDSPGSDGPSAADGTMPEASTDGAADAAKDVGPMDAYVFEASPDAPVCDRDGDHDDAKGGTCGGTDCDDNDPRAYLTEPNYLTYAPTPVTNGDWNCDGTVEYQFAQKVSCLLASPCLSTAGFTGSVGCGASGSFLQCTTNMLGVCVDGAMTTNTQGCK